MTTPERQVSTHPRKSLEIPRSGEDMRGVASQSRSKASLAGALFGGRSTRDPEAVNRTDVRAASTGGTNGVRWRAALVFVVLVFAIAGCGQPAPVANAPSVGELTAGAGATAGGEASAAREGAADATRPADKRQGTDVAANDGGTQSSSGDTDTGTAGNAAPGTDEASKQVPKFDPDKMPPKHVVKVSATVSPECVRPGGTITINVKTLPEAGVGYHAFYADGKGGGPPPYGASYGGNDGGLADEEGAYSDEWTVAANAPSGPGRVDVIVGHDAKYGDTKVPFAVADPITGMCS